MLGESPSEPGGGWEEKKYQQEEFGFLLGEGGCGLVHYWTESWPQCEESGGDRAEWDVRPVPSPRVARPRHHIY